MPFGPFQGTEILIIFAILLLILGPSKIPALARGLGEAVREFRRAASGVESTKKEVERDLREAVSASPSGSFTVSESRIRSSKVDDETLLKLADKLGVDSKGKSRDELVEEIVRKAKSKGLLEN
ncbi:MAG: twin-arginine translocase TatA/TatE family subunit [Desulfurococcales archaeon]|nr:twin-arginine translocase TatA/TatE family subunit [Desulfurococcales archaeon]